MFQLSGNMCAATRHLKNDNAAGPGSVRSEGANDVSDRELQEKDFMMTASLRRNDHVEENNAK